MPNDWGKMREELVGKDTDYRTTKKIVEQPKYEPHAVREEVRKRMAGHNPSIQLPGESSPGIKTVGNTPMPTAGSSQPHGYGHTASQRDGALRLSGNPKAHRIGKR